MRTTDGFDLEQQNKPDLVVSNVTRAHRELAVKTMYPDCGPDSYMWIEFVESGNSNAYRTLARVAQVLADAAHRAPVVHVGYERDVELVHKALHTGQASAAKVDAQRAFDRLVARWKANP